MQQHHSTYFAHRPPPRTLGVGSKGEIQILQNMVMLHNNLNGVKNAATCKQIFCLPDPHQPPIDPAAGVKIQVFRTWSCCISNEMESRMQQHGSKYFGRADPPLTLGSKGQNSTFSDHGHAVCQIRGNQ